MALQRFVSDFLALPPARQEDIANEALRHLLLGIPPGHDDSDFTALVHFRKGFHAFFDIIPFPQRDNLAEITKYFWSGSLKKPCDILGRLDITLRSGDRIDTSWSQTSSILRKLGDADHEDVMFLIMLHDWIEAPGDVTNALRFLKGCAEHTSLAPDMKIQIEFADDLEDDVHLSLSVCAPRLTVSVGFDQWIWHAYSRTSQAAFAPEVLFNCAFADGPSIFNAP
ncbi:hypothetical protein EXIGLDRAFT_777141 [Exidia glandulosa HHB12029]|uniref:Uncharacterized protein n=1 Tax=Exidia glandulosa HHB12029 TaxID=1314781 RepID=A0A165D5W7_EXIGL|nr:hypothetical protein EXIGLDRAFT_777141 [Exidia glandulosa HHB12029]